MRFVSRVLALAAAIGLSTAISSIPARAQQVITLNGAVQFNDDHAFNKGSAQFLVPLPHYRVRRSANTRIALAAIQDPMIRTPMRCQGRRASAASAVASRTIAIAATTKPACEAIAFAIVISYGGALRASAEPVAKPMTLTSQLETGCAATTRPVQANKLRSSCLSIPDNTRQAGRSRIHCDTVADRQAPNSVGNCSSTEKGFFHLRSK